MPDRTMVIGSAKNVFETYPPNVANAHTAKKITKNKIPSATLALGDTGCNGRIVLT